MKLLKLKTICWILLSGLLLSVAWAAGEGIFTQQRERMVEEQIVNRGVTDELVLKALRDVKRHLFVPEEFKPFAYQDRPLPIGYGQTISQPYIVAYMSEKANLKANDRVLEIGTGSGYQAAILAEIVKEVYTIEIIESLADLALTRLKALGYTNIKIRHGDGYKGWPEHAPFDVIVVTAAPSEIPEELSRQLKVGGRMVVPVGSIFQELYLIVRTEKGYDKHALLPVRFVPMVHSSDIDKP